MQWGLCSYVRLYAWPLGRQDAICFIPKMALLALLTFACYQCGYHALKLLATINCATRWVIPLQHCADPMCEILIAGLLIWIAEDKGLELGFI